MRCLAAFLASLMVAFTAFAAPAPDEAVIRARTEAISKSLRCVVCQSESIHDSNAPLAADMRRQVETMVREGESDEAIRAFFQARYGDYVLMRPPVQGNTWLLWFGPLALVVIGLAWLWWRARRGAVSTGPEPAANTMSDEDRARVQAALSGSDDNEAHE
jgi:cytochrome c-type biogenesis protein CcmH